VHESAQVQLEFVVLAMRTLLAGPACSEIKKRKIFLLPTHPEDVQG
jgi:hypothetical protein